MSASRICCPLTFFLPRLAHPGPPFPENMGDVDFDADVKRILDRCAVGAVFWKWLLSLGVSQQGGVFTPKDVAVISLTESEVRADIFDEAAKPGDHQVADATLQ